MLICDVCHEGALEGTARCGQCGSDLRATRSKPGTQLTGMVLAGKYALEDFIQEGGMGYVYRARHLALDKVNAIKLMKPTPDADEGRIARFRHEAKAASHLQHPHIISILDFGQTRAGLLYLVSELVHGATLSDELRRSTRLPTYRVLRIFAQLMAAVEEAHSHELIHRDLKTDNIMLTRLRTGEDYVKVLDFGIAMLLSETDPRLTREGEICGTPAYMAPEQIRSEAITVQTDIYALGVILFELITGTVPFEGETVKETLFLQLKKDPPPLMQLVPWSRELPELNEVVLRALAKDPRDRFHNVSHMRDALFSLVDRHQMKALPCKACHRPHDSALGFCSDHCMPTFSRESVEAVTSKPPPNGDRHADEGQPHWSLAPTPLSELPTDQGLGDSDQPTLDGEMSVGGNGASSSESSRVTVDSWSEASRPTDRLRKLVGRSSELSEIKEFISGSTVAVEMIGPTGLGKSALLAHAEDLAQKHGFAVFASGVDPSWARTPWQPVRQLVARVLGSGGQPLDLDMLRRRAVELGLDTFDVKALLTLAATSWDTHRQDPAVFLREVTGTALRLLLDAETPRLFAFDDVHSYDGASRRFVKKLAEEAEGTPHKVALASQSSLLCDDGPHRSIYLGPLPPETWSVLVDYGLSDIGLSHVAPDAIEGLRTVWQGNPLLLQQGLAALAEGAVSVSPSVHDLMQARLGQLPREAREVARALCVLGERAPLSLVRALVSDEETLSRGRSFLIARRICEPLDGDALCFAHAVPAQTIHAQIPHDERRRLHFLAYQMLKESGTSPAVLSRHAFESRLGDEALALLRRAADEAIRLQDHETAGLVHYRCALHVTRWELLVGEGESEYAAISWRLARALRLSGHRLSAEVVLKESLNALVPHSQEKPWVDLELVRLHLACDRQEEALTLIRQSLRQAILSGRTEPMVDFYLELAETLSDQGQGKAALRELEEGILMVTGGEDVEADKAPGGFWKLLLAAAQFNQRHDRLVRAMELAQRAAVAARLAGSRAGQAISLLRAACVMQKMGRFKGALRALGRAAAQFRAMGDRQGLVHCLVVQSRVKPRERPALLERARTLAEQLLWHEAIEELSRAIDADESPDLDILEHCPHAITQLRSLAPAASP